MKLDSILRDRELEPYVPLPSLRSILAAALLLRIVFMLITPFDDQHRRLGIQGFNDEMSHINYVRYLAAYGSLPVETRSAMDQGAFVSNDFEYYQPPLYYLLAAPAYLAAEIVLPGRGFYAIRLVSVLFGVLTVAAAHRVGARFDAKLGRLCAGTLAIFPTHVYFTAIATNDSLAWLIGALLVSSQLAPPDRPASMARTALLLALGMLSKSTLLTLVPLVFVKPALSAWHRKDPRALLRPLGAGLTALVATLPYYLRNLRLYGSALGMEAGHGAQVGFLVDPSWRRVYEFASWSVATFWNPLNLALSFQNPLLKAGLAAMTLGGIILLAAGWWRIARTNRVTADHLVLWTAVGLAFAGYAAYNLRYPQSDARLMFHALLGLLGAFGLALKALRPRIGYSGAEKS